jgi:ATP-dependent DNA helicase RecQ
LTRYETIDATTISQKILSAVIKTGNRFGKNYILDVLLGKNTQKIRRNNHDKLSVFGIASQWREDELGQMIIQLLHKGVLMKTEDRYPVISLSPKGKIWLAERRTIRLRKPTPDQFGKEYSERREPDHDRQLFTKLREARKELADKNNVPPFVIFGDTSLQQMATYYPTTKEKLGVIHGVGQAKMEKYGDRFLAVINEYVKEKSITPPDMPAKKMPKRSKKPVIRQVGRYRKTKELIGKKVEIERIAKHQDIKTDTVVNHIEKLLDAGEKLDLEYLKLPRDRYQEIKKAFDREGDEFLKPVFEALEGKYSYPELKLVRVIKDY